MHWNKLPFRDGLDKVRLEALVNELLIPLHLLFPREILVHLLEREGGVSAVDKVSEEELGGGSGAEQRRRRMGSKERLETAGWEERM